LCKPELDWNHTPFGLEDATTIDVDGLLHETFVDGVETNGVPLSHAVGVRSDLPAIVNS
jgi:hypothetical protein